MGKPKSSKSRYQQQFGGGSKAPASSTTSSDDAALLAARRQARQQKGEQIDAQFGFETFAFQNSNVDESRESRERRGWLFNMLPTTVRQEKIGSLQIFSWQLFAHCKTRFLSPALLLENGQ
jgi:hypothetical protein